ncbi:hypothetical protein P692DRAFT_201805467 [Suillus brevipes Sb2]|nr:hypothetical protein P692DRAFT_201805467 [Suillus brevipes Sb2]
MNHATHYRTNRITPQTTTTTRPQQQPKNTTPHHQQARTQVRPHPHPQQPLQLQPQRKQAAQVKALELSPVASSRVTELLQEEVTNSTDVSRAEQDWIYPKALDHTGYEKALLGNERTGQKCWSYKPASQSEICLNTDYTVLSQTTHTSKFRSPSIHDIFDKADPEGGGGGGDQEGRTALHNGNKDKG